MREHGTFFFRRDRRPGERQRRSFGRAGSVQWEMAERRRVGGCERGSAEGGRAAAAAGAAAPSIIGVRPRCRKHARMTHHSKIDCEDQRNSPLADQLWGGSRPPLELGATCKPSPGRQNVVKRAAHFPSKTIKEEE